MIRYNLRCDADHRFDSWFRDSAAFDALATAGALSCPTCGSLKVEKAVMAPALVKRRTERAPVPASPVPSAGAEAPVAASEAPAQPVAVIGPEERALRDMIRTLHRKITATADDVGRAFPDQARRMHEGELPQRPIFGQATNEEVRELLQDGVPVLPVPTLPEEGH